MKRQMMALAAVGVLAGSGAGAATGLVFVSNEKSSTISVLNPEHEVIETFETCARPRGMHFSADRTSFFVGCADDSVIAEYEVATRKLLRRITDVAEPETFDLHPDGRHLYVSNEEDAAATVWDLETGEQTGFFETGEEPEGVQATPDGKLVFVASEAANLVHVIDVEAQEVIADILVDTRPRRFALTPDARELWVSAELSGVINIIDVATLEVIGDIPFLPAGFRPEQVTPVDVLITADGSPRLRGARPGQPRRGGRRRAARGRRLHPRRRARLGPGAQRRREDALRGERPVGRPLDHRRRQPARHHRRCRSAASPTAS